MKKCPDCGKEYDGNAKFCFECGGKLEPIVEKLLCPQCGTEYMDGAKFCMECGFKLFGISASKSPSVSLGDANAISGGVDASSNSHNTTTVNKSNVVTETHTTANTNTTTSNSNNTTTNVFNIQGGMSGAIGGFNLGGGRGFDEPELFEVTFNANSPCIIFDRFQEVARITEGDEYGRFHISLPMKKGMHRFEFVCIEDKKIKKELIKAIKSDEDTIIDIQLDLPIALKAPQPLQPHHPIAQPETTEEVVMESSSLENVVAAPDIDFDDINTTIRPTEEQLKKIPVMGEFVNGEFIGGYSKSGNKYFGFDETSSLEEYAIIPGTDVICDDAFKDTLLETIYLPASIKLISKSAFDNCDNLKNIIVPDGSLQDFKGIIDRKYWSLLKCGDVPGFERDFDSAIVTEEDYKHCFIYIVNGTAQYCLSGSCQRLLEAHNNFNLKEVSVPPFVRILCDGTFNRCDTVERIVLPPTIELIGEGVFEFCPNLREIVVPKGTIEYFKNLVSPEAANHLVEEEVYLDILAEIAPDPLMPSEQQVGEHINCEYVADYSNDGKQLIAVNENASWLKEYHVLDGTEAICNRAFKYSSVETVFLPRSLKIVGEKIFEYCKNLKEICIPKGQASRFFDMIPDYADLMVEVPMLPQRPNTNPAQEEEEKGHFMYDPLNEICYSPDLTRVLGHQNIKLDWLTLLNSTRVICDGAFEDSIATTIEIPESVEVVGENAFNSPSIKCICSSSHNEAHLQTLLKGSKCAKFINNFDFKDEIINELEEPEEGVCYKFNDNSLAFYNHDNTRFLGLSDGYDMAELSIGEGTTEFGDPNNMPNEGEHWDSVTTINLPKSIKSYNWSKPLKAYFPNLKEIRVSKNSKAALSQILSDVDCTLLCLPGQTKADSQPKAKTEVMAKPVNKETAKKQCKSADSVKPQPQPTDNANADVVKYSVVKNGRVFKGLSGKYNGKILELAPDTIDIDISDSDYENPNFDYGEQIETIVLPAGLKNISNPTFPVFFDNLKSVVVPEGQFKKFAKLLDSYWFLIDDGKVKRPWMSILDKSTSEWDLDIMTVHYGINTIFSASKKWRAKYLLVPETIHTIEKNALESSLFETVFICEGLKTIINGAFKNCKSLTTVYLPKSLTNIETGGFLAAAPFSGCSQLKKIVVPKGSKAKFRNLLEPLKLSHLIIESK